MQYPAKALGGVAQGLGQVGVSINQALLESVGSLVGNIAALPLDATMLMKYLWIVDKLSSLKAILNFTESSNAYNWISQLQSLQDFLKILPSLPLREERKTLEASYFFSSEEQ